MEQTTESSAPRSDADESTSQTGSAARRRLLGWALAFAMVAPPLIAIVAMAGRTYHPVDDFAIIDLRVRDVWSAHASLTGLFSRPGWNHPGPALFWLIALVSGPFGQASWATRVGGALIDGVAMGWLAWVTWRSGLRTMFAAAAVVGMTYLAIGSWVIRQPWNLHIPLVALPLVLFFALLVATGSSRHLIGLAIAATVVVQTHVGFVLPVATAIGFALVCVAVDARRAHHLPDRWRSTVTITVGALAVLWAPPIIDVLVNWPGNLGKIAKYFAAGAYDHVGLSEAAGIVAGEFRFLPPWLGGRTHLVIFTGFAATASLLWLLVPIVVLGLGVLAAVRTGRRTDRRMVALAVALFAVTIFAISRADEPRAYTFEWRVVVAAFVVAAGVRAVTTWLPRPRVTPAVAATLAAGLVVWGAIDLGVRVTSDEPAPLEARATALTELLPVLRSVPDARRVLVRPAGTTLRSVFDGVINELDRDGVDVRVDPKFGRIFGGRRRADPSDVDDVWYVTEQGSVAQQLMLEPGARLVASTSPLSPAENAELDRLQATLRAQLVRAGKVDAVAFLDNSLLAYVVRGIPGVDQRLAARTALLNHRVERDHGCRCTIVAVPGGRR